MSYSVYISTDNLVIVKGKSNQKRIVVQSYSLLPLPEGAVINGMVINEEIVREKLIQARSEGILPRKNVRLVFDRSSILIKMLRVPEMSHLQVLNFLENTFSTASNVREKLLYDYTLIEMEKTKGEGNLILGTAIEKSFIEEYIRLFSGAGIKLSSISIALNSIIQYQKTFNPGRRKTYILLFITGENVFLVMFCNGYYNISNRYRLNSKKGSPQSLMELNHILSSIIQFNKAQKENLDIEYVAISGLQNNENYYYGELSTLLNIKVIPLTAGPELVMSRELTENMDNMMNNFIAIANLIE